VKVRGAPYFSHGGISVLLGTWARHLRSVPDESVDVIVADPPYGETSLAWDRAADLGWLPEAERVLRRSGTLWLFGSMRMLLGCASATLGAGWQLSENLVWEKQNGTGFQPGSFKRVHEHVLRLRRPGVRGSEVFSREVTTNDALERSRRTRRKRGHPYHLGPIVDERPFESVEGGPRIMRSVVYMANEHGSAVNPTQKPVGLVVALLRASAPAGGMVLDPTCGSGTTLVAARRLGLRAVGVEVDPEQCGHAARRVVETIPGTDALETAPRLRA
jgi:site-specific DNA-methyltransferase (adenine-specific)